MYLVFAGVDCWLGLLLVVLDATVVGVVLVSLTLLARGREEGGLGERCKILVKPITIIAVIG